MPKPSKGARALADICSKAERGQTTVAERLQENQSLVSRWVTGDRKPSAQNRKVIQDAYGIEWTTWDEDEAGGADETTSDAEGAHQ